MLPLIILLYINLPKNNGQWTGWYEQFMFFFYFLLFLFANRRIFYRSFYFQNLKHSTIGLGKHFSPEYGCSLHSELPLKSLWMIGEELTTKHGMLGTNVMIDASMTGSALKITSFGWKTSMP